MRYGDVATHLERLRCHELPRSGGGSHRKWVNPANGRSTIVPDHGRKDLSIGLVRAVVRQLGLDWQEFRRSG